MNQLINLIREHQLITFFIVVYLVINSLIAVIIAEHGKNQKERLNPTLLLYLIILLIGIPSMIYVCFIVAYEKLGLDLYFRAKYEDRSEYDMPLLVGLINHSEKSIKRHSGKKQKTIYTWCSIKCHKHYIKALNEDIKAINDRIISEIYHEKTK